MDELPPALPLLADGDPGRRPLPDPAVRDPRPGGLGAGRCCPAPRPRTSTSPTSTGCARRPSCSRSSTGPSAASCRRGSRPTSRSSATSAWSCVLVYSSGGPSSVFTFLYLVVIGGAGVPALPHGRASSSPRSRRSLHGLDGRADGLRGPAPARRWRRRPRWGAERIGYNLAITIVGFYGVAFMVVLPLREAARRPRGARAAPEGALAHPDPLRQRHRVDVLGPGHRGLARARHVPEPGRRRDPRHRARARHGRCSPEIGLNLPSGLGRDPAAHARAARATGPRSRSSAARRAASLGYSVRALKDPDGRGRGAHRLPGPDRGEEARAPGALQRAAGRRRRARGRHRARDPQSARLDLGLGAGALATSSRSARPSGA